MPLLRDWCPLPLRMALCLPVPKEGAMTTDDYKKARGAAPHEPGMISPEEAIRRVRGDESERLARLRAANAELVEALRYDEVLAVLEDPASGPDDHIKALESLGDRESQWMSPDIVIANYTDFCSTKRRAALARAKEVGDG